MDAVDPCRLTEVRTLTDPQQQHATCCCNQDNEAQAALEQEAAVSQDFEVLKVQETYENLVLKVPTSCMSCDCSARPLHNNQHKAVPTLGCLLFCLNATHHQWCHGTMTVVDHLFQAIMLDIMACNCTDILECIYSSSVSDHSLWRSYLQAYAFFQHVQARYNPAFIIKTDDDLYIRLVNILLPLLPAWRQ